MKKTAVKIVLAVLLLGVAGSTPVVADTSPVPLLAELSVNKIVPASGLV